MYVINLFPILCILYVLLPKRVKSIPIGDSLDDQQTAQLNKESSSYFQKLSGKQSLSLQHNRRTSRQGKHIQNEKKSLAPDYMLALYETFSSSKDDLPKSNIVRSFKNLNSQGNVFDSMLMLHNVDFQGIPYIKSLLWLSIALRIFFDRFNDFYFCYDPATNHVLLVRVLTNILHVRKNADGFWL